MRRAASGGSERCGLIRFRSPLVSAMRQTPATESCTTLCSPSDGSTPEMYCTKRSLGPTTRTVGCSESSRCWKRTHAARCSATTVLPVPGPPWMTRGNCGSLRISRSWSAWIVATISPIAPLRCRSSSSSRRSDARSGLSLSVPGSSSSPRDSRVSSLTSGSSRGVSSTSSSRGRSSGSSTVDSVGATCSSSRSSCSSTLVRPFGSTFGGSGTTSSGSATLNPATSTSSL